MIVLINFYFQSGMHYREWKLVYFLESLTKLAPIWSVIDCSCSSFVEFFKLTFSWIHQRLMPNVPKQYAHSKCRNCHLCPRKYPEEILHHLMLLYSCYFVWLHRIRTGLFCVHVGRELCKLDWELPHLALIFLYGENMLMSKNQGCFWTLIDNNPLARRKIVLLRPCQIVQLQV